MSEAEDQEENNFSSASICQLHQGKGLSKNGIEMHQELGDDGAIGSVIGWRRCKKSRLSWRMSAKLEIREDHAGS
jgi:hypothetical protein